MPTMNPATCQPTTSDCNDCSFTVTSLTPLSTGATTHAFHPRQSDNGLSGLPAALSALSLFSLWPGSHLPALFPSPSPRQVCMPSGTGAPVQGLLGGHAATSVPWTGLGLCRALVGSGTLTALGGFHRPLNAAPIRGSHLSPLRFLHVPPWAQSRGALQRLLPHGPGPGSQTSPRGLPGAPMRWGLLSPKGC